MIKPCENEDCVNFSIWEYRNGELFYDIKPNKKLRKKFNQKFGSKLRGAGDGKFFTITPILICPACSHFKTQNFYEGDK